MTADDDLRHALATWGRDYDPADIPTCHMCGARFDPADDGCDHGNGPLCPDHITDGCGLCADEIARDRWDEQAVDARIEERAG